jgi:hypothetical protein
VITSLPFNISILIDYFHLAFPPPPLPPANFTGMSEEAIRAMEGTELTHVQARIQCLRNVRTLLDASMIQMQQYMNIVLTQRFVHSTRSHVIVSYCSIFIAIEIVIWKMV